MRILSEEQAELAEPDQIHEVLVTLLHPNPDNSKVYESQKADNPDFQMLCDTMKKVGQNEEPITITPDCEIISGHRRWGAARQIGMQFLRCVIDRAAKSPEIRRLKLIMHNMHRRKSRVEMAREIIYWEEAIDAFWRNDPHSMRIAPREVAERFSKISDDERAFLQRIIDQHVILPKDGEDDDDYDIASLKRNYINSSTQVALRFLGQSKNTQVVKLKTILQAADTLRANGAADVAVEIEKLLDQDEINKAHAMAKNYNASLKPQKMANFEAKTPQPKRSFKHPSRVVLGCRTSLNQIREILASHKLWLRCAESHKSITCIQELLVKVETLEEQYSRRTAAVSRPSVIREGEDLFVETPVEQPTPKNQQDEIETLLNALT